MISPEQGNGVMLKIRSPVFYIKGDQIMCGIVGYTGRHQAAPILLDSLSRLEYRGYDSAGLAVRNGTALAEVVKATGKLADGTSMIAPYRSLDTPSRRRALTNLGRT